MRGQQDVNVRGLVVMKLGLGGSRACSNKFWRVGVIGTP